MINPITGRTLTPAEVATVVARFAEATDTWTRILDFATEMVGQVDDPHKQLVGIGMWISDVVGAQTPTDLPREQWAGFCAGHLVGILAVAAADAARRGTP